MTKALVFGKFLPFHKGHEALINFALKHCDFLSVLVCASDKENIPAALRQKWIKETFIGEEKLEVKVFEYSEKDLPNTSESSREVSRIWSETFMREFPDHDLIISSEKYGDYVAEYMGIKHLSFDPPRKLVPVSATHIRQNLLEHWKFLPKSVKPYYAKKIVVLGTESTGKTTLVKNLSQHFNCTAVFEAGRDLIPDSSSFAFEDLYKVAELHASRIARALEGEHPLLIIDTDIHITNSYATFSFGKRLEVPDSMYEINKANLYLYLNKDVPFIQDGTRMDEKERNLLDHSHRQELRNHQINIHEIRGQWEERFEQAKNLIQGILS